MFVNVDAAALEWRTAVWLSMDPTGVDEIKNKEDAHTKNQHAFNLPDRHTAKIYLFRTIYRGTGYGFAKDPKFSHVSSDPAFWDRINRLFYEKYQGLDTWHQGLGRICAEHGVYRNPFGRFWKFSPTTDYKGDYKIPWTVITNYPVQGTGADLVCIARVILQSKLERAGLEGFICLTVHDSIVVDCPEREVRKVAKLAYEAFNELEEYCETYFNVKLPFPFPGEVKYGSNLADMTKISEEELNEY